MLAFCQRIADRARWEFKEWRRPSRASFLQEELDRALLSEVQWRPGERVLDVGCANGSYLQALKAGMVSAVGIDISLASLHRAKDAGAGLAVASGDSLPFAGASFDTVLCHKTMYLFESPDTVIDEFSRVIRPGGRVVFSGSNTKSPYARSQALAISLSRNRRWSYGNRLSIRDWIQAFTRHGLHVRRIYSCNLTWPIIFRLNDRWLVPNEWMRRYNRWIRRLSGAPLRTLRPLRWAQDYVVEVQKPSAC